MNERNRRMLMINAFLLLIFSAIPLWSQTVRNVCSTCHVNATCEDKPDGSGKVCNCKYGFVGNGIHFCQDKDECQIGATKICGQHTTCHNTYGSYYCTCLAGYSPSNNMAVFIPNDGTHCQDIDECRITGLCGEGGLCRNLEGSFDCSCHVGYRVHNGSEPFQPQRDGASCRVVDCGQPSLVEDTVLLSITGTKYGDMASFGCDEGFVWRRGDNSSVCRADGSWSGATLVCEEILCGNPPLIEFTEQVWNQSSSPGSTVLYLCKEGFHSNGGYNVSICSNNGKWTSPTLSCQEMLCGDPPVVPHTAQLWDGSFTFGSTATYYCKIGFYHHDGSNVSVCAENGYWTLPDILCKEIICSEPPFIDHANMQLEGKQRVGSVVYYQCEEGYYTTGLRNYSECGENGLWQDVDLLCEEVNCGPPTCLPNTKLLWDGSSTPGSVAQCACVDGFYQESGNNLSTCLKSGVWGEISVKCKAECGPVPFLAHSEVVWHNRSTVVHRCAVGYHSWRGTNMSLCSGSGLWVRATLKCIEIKPPINQLRLHNGHCLEWKAEKYEEDTEFYKVIYLGSRDYLKSFLDKGRRLLRSKDDWLRVCLKLLPLTNYSISITAVKARFTATITTNTSLTVPPSPVVYYTELETPVPTLRLKRSPNTLDPISFYQIFVLPVEKTLLFDCSSPRSLNSSITQSPAEYMTAQLVVQNLTTDVNFTVGDGFLYGGFYNAPLESGNTYFIVLRVISQWKTVS
ncbi:sushi domain-containing protein 1 isoform X4 [Cyprinodon tularosa]|uniref:sushi domain-containing protein 1 isoform X4 n=1 Tax=Cyprinodon tularosa TaxID=77115 RepID=UPI0018E21FB7|nr:sushi domain-containing protein 1 isoform X4 [Cyprinodon tularosa]